MANAKALNPPHLLKKIVPTILMCRRFTESHQNEEGKASIAAKMNFECCKLECLQIANCLNANLLEAILSDFADTGNTADRERSRKLSKSFG